MIYKGTFNDSPRGKVQQNGAIMVESHTTQRPLDEDLKPIQSNLGCIYMASFWREI
jgi:hypothetical protein